MSLGNILLLCSYSRIIYIRLSPRTNNLSSVRFLVSLTLWVLSHGGCLLQIKKVLSYSPHLVLLLHAWVYLAGRYIIFIACRACSWVKLIIDFSS